MGIFLYKLSIFILHDIELRIRAFKGVLSPPLCLVMVNFEWFIHLFRGPCIFLDRLCNISCFDFFFLGEESKEADNKKKWLHGIGISMTNNHANSQTPNCFSILHSTFFLKIKKVDCIVRILSFYSNIIVVINILVSL